MAGTRCTLAKFGATISEMSGWRWGLNMVTGYKKSEFEMFRLLGR